MTSRSKQKIEVTCPVCHEKRMATKKNKYSSTNTICRPCLLKQFKAITQRHLGKE